jgi:hypothetical protein
VFRIAVILHPPLIDPENRPPSARLDSLQHKDDILVELVHSVVGDLEAAAEEEEGDRGRLWWE